MLEVRPLAEPFGAEIRGWEPSRQLSAREFDEIRQALHAHVLLVFRGHPRPADTELAAFGQRFGELFAGGELYGLQSHNRDILRVSNELDDAGYEVGYVGAGYLPWHTDYSFMPRASKETLFSGTVDLGRRHPLLMLIPRPSEGAICWGRSAPAGA